MARNKWGQSKIIVIVVGGRVWGNFTLTPDIEHISQSKII